MTFDIGKNVFVRATSACIDIRKWDGIRGEWKAKKGIRLTLQNWHRLLGVNEHLVADIHNIVTKREWVNQQYCIGDDIYICIASPCHWVHIFVSPDGSISPRHEGLGLTFRQWRKLIEFSTLHKTTLSHDSTDSHHVETDGARDLGGLL